MLLHWERSENLILQLQKKDSSCRSAKLPDFERGLRERFSELQKLGKKIP